MYCILTLFGGDGEFDACSPLNLLLFRMPALGDADGEYTLGIWTGLNDGLPLTKIILLDGGEFRLETFKRFLSGEETASSLRQPF